MKWIVILSFPVQCCFCDIFCCLSVDKQPGYTSGNETWDVNKPSGLHKQITKSYPSEVKEFLVLENKVPIRKIGCFLEIR